MRFVLVRVVGSLLMNCTLSFGIEKVYSLILEHFLNRMQFTNWELQQIVDAQSYLKGILWVGEARFSQNKHNSHI